MNVIFCLLNSLKGIPVCVPLALAIEAKEKFAQNFVEFSLTYFFLPNKSNSSEEIYQLYLGPIDGESKAKQWSKLIGEKNQVINF